MHLLHSAMAKETYRRAWGRAGSDINIIIRLSTIANIEGRRCVKKQGKTRIGNDYLQLKKKSLYETTRLRAVKGQGAKD